eukprot:4781347-Amphidinium_carterae.1
MGSIKQKVVLNGVEEAMQSLHRGPGPRQVLKQPPPAPSNRAASNQRKTAIMDGKAPDQPNN